MIIIHFDSINITLNIKIHLLLNDVTCPMDVCGNIILKFQNNKTKTTKKRNNYMTNIIMFKIYIFAATR